jgi:putative ABC transport system substrate-binding protein
MNAPRLIATALLAGLLSSPLAADAQQPGKVPRIGYLMERAGPGAFDEAFLRGLRELGYVDGRTILVEYRWAGGKAERLPALAAELVGLGVDLIVTAGVPAAKAAKHATATIPVVMATSGDAVRDGLVASFGRPGGNVTGMSLFTSELSRKRLEILKETFAGLASVAALFNGLNPALPPQLRETEAAAAQLGIRVVPVDVRFPGGLGAAFARAARAGAGAVIVLSDNATITHRAQIATVALEHRLPTMFANKAYLEGGGLMSYGPDIVESFRRAALYVDRILKGARPADLPVEQPTRLELALNLKTARALGLTIPQSILVRADAVLE